MLCSTHGRPSPGKTRGRNSGDLNPGTQPGEPGATGRHQIHFLPLQELGNSSFGRILISWSESSSFCANREDSLVAAYLFPIAFVVSSAICGAGGQSFAAAPAKMSSGDGAKSRRTASGEAGAELHLTFLPLLRVALFSLAAPESNILDEAELN